MLCIIVVTLCYISNIYLFSPATVSFALELLKSKNTGGDDIYAYLKPQHDETDDQQAERIAKVLVSTKNTIALDSRALSGHALFEKIEANVKKYHSEKQKEQAKKNPAGATVTIAAGPRRKAKKKPIVAVLQPPSTVPPDAIDVAYPVSVAASGIAPPLRQCS